MYRQGDVLLVPVDGFPAQAHPVEHTVVAHGEMTGHTHRFATGAEQFVVDDGTQFVRVIGRSADLVHEEHGTLTLPGPRVYRVVHQREYAPGPEFRPWVDRRAVRPVRD